MVDVLLVERRKATLHERGRSSKGHKGPLKGHKRRGLTPYALKCLARRETLRIAAKCCDLLRSYLRTSIVRVSVRTAAPAYYGRRDRGMGVNRLAIGDGGEMV